MQCSAPNICQYILPTATTSWLQSSAAWLAPPTLPPPPSPGDRRAAGGEKCFDAQVYTRRGHPRAALPHVKALYRHRLLGYHPTGITTRVLQSLSCDGSATLIQDRFYKHSLTPSAYICLFSRAFLEKAACSLKAKKHHHTLREELSEKRRGQNDPKSRRRSCLPCRYINESVGIGRPL